MKVTPETLRANKEIRDMLWPFDFEVVDNRACGLVWFDAGPLEPFEIVAQRASGCIYALTGPQRHVLLATTDGQAGIGGEPEGMSRTRGRASLLAGCSAFCEWGSARDEGGPARQD